jgi:hypothetical protein
LGAKPEEVLYFVECWDGQKISDEALRKQLEALWHERLADAELMQEFLTADDEEESEKLPFERCTPTSI